MSKNQAPEASSQATESSNSVSRVEDGYGMFTAKSDPTRGRLLDFDVAVAMRREAGISVTLSVSRATLTPTLSRKRERE